MKIDIQNDRVVFTFDNGFVDNNVVITITDRFFATMGHCFRDMYAIEEYFVNNGDRSAYLGKRRCKNDRRMYNLWDVSKIFPNVRFQNNEKEFKSFFTIKH